MEKRALVVQGPARALRVAALSAPGFGNPPGTAALARLREVNADLLILLGGVGESEAAATATFKALASLSAPTVVVPGGRDTWAARDKAFEDLPPEARIIDGTVLRAIRIGNHTFVPLPGAERGRYSLHAAACGFDQADLESAAQELGNAQPGEQRWLLSWQAPTFVAGVLGPRTESKVATGSPLVAQFAEKIGAKGALYAWPADETTPLREGPLGVATVPRLFGPRLETSTGAQRAHGVLVLSVGADGVRVVL